MSLRDTHKIKEIIYNNMAEYCIIERDSNPEFIKASEESAKAIEKNFVRRQKQSDKIEIKEKKNYCRICGKYTTQIFNIDLKPSHICKKCERRIVLQSIDDYYKLTNPTNVDIKE